MTNIGVYKITNIKNNKVYIGSSQNLRKRKHYHFTMLQNNKHHSIHLQRGYNRTIDAKTNFKFEVLKYCTKEELLDLENHYLNIYCKAQDYINNINKDFLKLSYNILPKAIEGYGGKHRPETILKLKMNHPLRKNILCYNQNGTLYKKFNTAGDAAKGTKNSRSSLLKLCKTKTYIGRNYVFGFENDENFLKFVQNSKKPILFIPHNKGKLATREEKNKMNTSGTKIKCTFIDNDVENEFLLFYSQREVCEFFNLQPCTVNRCLKNNKPYRKQILFEYYDIV